MSTNLNSLLYALGESTAKEKNKSTKIGIIRGLEMGWNGNECNINDIMDFIEGYCSQDTGKDTYLYPLVTMINPDYSDDEYVPEFDSKSKSYSHDSFLKGVSIVLKLLEGYQKSIIDPFITPLKAKM
jgi:hypothetical protein